MAIINPSTVPAEGTTFIFGFWICVTDGLGGFNSHLAHFKEMEAPVSTPSSDVDNFTEHLSEIQFSNIIREQSTSLKANPITATVNQEAI